MTSRVSRRHDAEVHMTTEKLEELKILQLPYADRQLVVVTDDVVAKAVRQAELESQAKQSTGNWSKIASKAASMVLGSPVMLIAELVTSTLDAWKRARESGMRVLQVAKSEAAELTFPPGHPRDGVLYIGHPARPGLYYTAAEFHRVTFEHKVSEAVRLLMHLGAIYIKVEHVKGWSREFAAHLGVPLGATVQTATVDVDSTSRAASTIIYEARLEGTKAPSLPQDLIWYSHEPTWQSVAEGRLKFGLQDFSLSIVYEDDFGIHAGLKGTALKAGFDLGGHFETHTSTIWRISGQFAALDKGS
jgi:hypothetical protein